MLGGSSPASTARSESRSRSTGMPMSRLRRCSPCTSSARSPQSSAAARLQAVTRSCLSTTTTLWWMPARIDPRNAFASQRLVGPLAELVVHRLELLVRGLQLLVHRLELLVGGLQLLVRRLELLVGGLELLVRRLELLDGRLQLLVRRLELAARLLELDLQRPVRVTSPNETTTPTNSPVRLVSGETWTSSVRGSPSLGLPADVLARDDRAAVRAPGRAASAARPAGRRSRGPGAAGRGRAA